MAGPGVAMAITPNRILKPGRCYFMLSFFDDASKFALIESYVFLGLDLMEGDSSQTERTWYFKDPEQFLTSGYKLDALDQEHCIRVGEDTIELVLDHFQLAEQLKSNAATLGK
jgi:hypothetical protein